MSHHNLNYRISVKINNYESQTNYKHVAVCIFVYRTLIRMLSTMLPLIMCKWIFEFVTGQNDGQAPNIAKENLPIALYTYIHVRPTFGFFFVSCDGKTNVTSINIVNESGSTLYCLLYGKIFK